MKITKNLLLLLVLLFIAACKEDPQPSNQDLIDSLKLSNLNLKLGSAKAKDSLQRIIQNKNDSIAKAKGTQSVGSIIFTVSIVNGTNLSLANGRTSGTNGLSSVSVTIAQGGILSTVITGVSGQAVFPNMNIGTVAITIQATGFTTTNVIAILSKPAGSSTASTYSSTIVPIYSTSGSSLAVVSGRVFANTDATNSTLEKLPAKKIIARLNGSSVPKFTSDNAVIQSRGYESVVFTTTTGVDGQYSFSLPAGSSGNNLTYSFDFEQFVADQKTGASTSAKRKFLLATSTVAVQSEGIYFIDFFYEDQPANN
jgi:hypothetical protein